MSCSNCSLWLPYMFLVNSTKSHFSLRFHRPSCDTIEKALLMCITFLQIRTKTALAQSSGHSFFAQSTVQSPGKCVTRFIFPPFAASAAASSKPGPLLVLTSLLAFSTSENSGGCFSIVLVFHLTLFMLNFICTCKGYSIPGFFFLWRFHCHEESMLIFYCVNCWS